MQTENGNNFKGFLVNQTTIVYQFPSEHIMISDSDLNLIISEFLEIYYKKSTPELINNAFNFFLAINLFFRDSVLNINEIIFLSIIALINFFYIIKHYYKNIFDPNPKVSLLIENIKKFDERTEVIRNLKKK